MIGRSRMVSTSSELKTDHSSSHPGTAGGPIVGGRYRLQEKLGTGRAVLVYLADDLHVAGQQVVVKMAATTQASTQPSAATIRLRNEARALVALRFPAVP